TPPPHLGDGLPSLAPYAALDAALQTCLAKRREARPQDAAHMVALLESVEVTLAPPRPSAAKLASVPARTVFSPSTFIAAIDPDATLPPGAPAIEAADVSPFAPTMLPRAAESSAGLPSTTTGVVAQLRGSRRGVWLALGALAVVGMIAAVGIVA